MNALLVTEDCQRAIDLYTGIAENAELSGTGSNQTWEHARSYAVEALTALLNANPQVFTYRARMDKIAAERRRL